MSHIICPSLIIFVCEKLSTDPVLTGSVMETLPKVCTLGDIVVLSMSFVKRLLNCDHWPLHVIWLQGAQAIVFLTLPICYAVVNDALTHCNNSCYVNISVFMCSVTIVGIVVEKRC